MHFIPTMILAITIVFSPSEKKENLPEIQIGEPAPKIELALEDVVSGNDFTLKDLVKSNGLVVIFSSNTCPYVIAWENTYGQISEIGERFDIGTVLINSNEAFRGDQDSPKAMQSKAENGNYNMPYLIDVKHQLADAFGAKTTPHVFFFDANLNLIYKGAIDDRYEGGKKDSPEIYWLREAMFAVQEGRGIETSTSRQIGCSIKRVKK